MQLGGTRLWAASLSAVAQQISLTGFPCPVFHPSSFSSNKHIQTKTLRRANLSPGQRVSHRPVAGILEKRQVCWETPSSQRRWAYRYLHTQTARWGWRLLWSCCSLGFGPAHFMPNWNRTSSLHFDPSCKITGICFNFHWHCCSGCRQHSVVVLLNINATTVKAGRKCKMSTDGGVWSSTNLFLCMCQN